MALSNIEVSCPSCGAALPVGAANSGNLTPCPRCGVRTLVEVYPALLAPRETKGVGELIVDDKEASCFYHPGKKAEAHCSYCGRFLCALCDVDFDGKHLCSACIQAGRTKGTIEEFRATGKAHWLIALHCAVGGLLFPILTFALGPAAFYYAIRYRKHPGSPVGPDKGIFILTLALATLAILELVFVIGMIALG
jgi:hypothetical protein